MQEMLVGAAKAPCPEQFHRTIADPLEVREKMNQNLLGKIKRSLTYTYGKWNLLSVIVVKSECVIVCHIVMLMRLYK